MTNSSQIDPLKIDKLAKLAVKVGLGLKKGQNLIITASIESLPLVRNITKHAYKEGAGIVTTLFSDPDLILSRFSSQLVEALPFRMDNGGERQKDQPCSLVIASSFQRCIQLRKIVKTF